MKKKGKNILFAIIGGLFKLIAEFILFKVEGKITPFLFRLFRACPKVFSPVISRQ